MCKLQHQVAPWSWIAAWTLTELGYGKGWVETVFLKSIHSLGCHPCAVQTCWPSCNALTSSFIFKLCFQRFWFKLHGNGKRGMTLADIDQLSEPDAQRMRHVILIRISRQSTTMLSVSFQNEIPKISTFSLYLFTELWTQPSNAYFEKDQGLPKPKHMEYIFQIISN